MKKINIPFNKKAVEKLKAGDEVSFTGTVYTARDQAHKKLAELANRNKNLPFDIKGRIIYYCGPTAAAPGKKIGSCGPTTSQRMDRFVEPLLKKGLLGMIGKGRRAKSVREAIIKYKGIYFVAPAGCGALLAKKVVSKKLVCFKDLGPEAVYELEVERFPLIVAIDSKGKSIYGDI